MLATASCVGPHLLEMQSFSASRGVAFSTQTPIGSRRAAGRGRVNLRMRPLNAATKEREKESVNEDLGPYGNGYIPYKHPFLKERVYVWDRPPAGVDASKIFKPRAVPKNHFEQCVCPGGVDHHTHMLLA